MLTTELTPLTSATVLTDLDKDIQAGSLYRLLKELLDSLTITDQDVGVVIAGGAENIYAGHGVIPSGQATVTVTIGITLPNANYNVIVTFGDGLAENRCSYNGRTETTFVVRRSGGTTDALDFSWLVAY